MSDTDEMREAGISYAETLRLAAVGPGTRQTRFEEGGETMNLHQNRAAEQVKLARAALNRALMDASNEGLRVEVRFTEQTTLRGAKYSDLDVQMWVAV